MQLPPINFDWSIAPIETENKLTFEIAKYCTEKIGYKMKIIFSNCMGIVFLLFMLFSSCQKDRFITSSDAFLSVTADTIRFDTVFTSSASYTQSFKVININDQKIRLSQIKLMGANNSSFKININGINSTELQNVELAANDSIYVFVSVNIDANNQQTPFIVRDSILISYNGNNSYVQLEAFGQNAHFLRNQIITGNVTWNADLPYVILEKLQIDTNATLTIQSGCKIYAHADAPILVDGTLKVNGHKNSEIVFTGDRLDELYRDLPAGWPGIYFRKTSKDNELTFAIIKNAKLAVGVYNPSVNNNPKLIMHQCIIDNALEYGIYAENSSMNADNCLISNCGTNVNLDLGGDYNFSNCTIVSFSTLYLPHIKPVLSFSNFSVRNGVTFTADLEAAFKNCIFWGEGGMGDDELLIQKDNNQLFDVLFENCLYKNPVPPQNCNVISSIANVDPLFDSIDVFQNYFDFNITKESTSPAIDNGLLTPLNEDLNDNPRLSGLATDIGCYEKQ